MNIGSAGRREAAVTGCLSESVIKAHAPRVKARRAVAQPWRESGCRATEPGTVDRVPAWLVAALAVRSPSTRFSTPVAATVNKCSLWKTRNGLSVARRNRTLIGACDRARLRRLGSARAVKATDHQVVCLIYAMLTRGQDFIERGGADFESKRSRERQLTSPSTPSTTIQPRPRGGRARRLMHKSTTSHSQTVTGCYM